MSHHIVEVRDLCHAYPDGTEALKGVSFRITHGQAVALVGANGSALKFESARAERDFRNYVNRTTNCETANIVKVADASARQVAAIDRVLAHHPDRMPRDGPVRYIRAAGSCGSATNRRDVSAARFR